METIHRSSCGCKKISNKDIIEFDELNEIFHGSSATGKGSFSSVTVSARDVDGQSENLTSTPDSGPSIPS